MKSFINYALATAESVERELETSIAHGLSNKQIVEKKKYYGNNAIKQKRSVILDILKRQTKDPFLYLLIGSSLLSLFLQEHLNALMIGLLAVVSLVLSIYQEYFAEKTVALLNKLVSFHVQVKRNNEIMSITSEELVPGDIVLLEAGSLLSADIRLLHTENLLIDESALTGESLPVLKHTEALAKEPSLFEALNIGFSGTTVTSGKGIGIVIATGNHSALGTMAQAPTIAPRRNAFTQGIDRLTLFILVFVVGIIALVFGVNAIFKQGIIDTWQMLIFSISLAVTIIPEALGVVISFSLSIGARLLAKKKVIVKRLSSIDDFGSIQILCTDKTGTITTNELSVTRTHAFNNGTEQALIQAAMLCSTSLETNTPSHEPFDKALETACLKKDIDYSTNIHFVARIPFDPNRKRAVSLLTFNTIQTIFVRGAYEEVIARCSAINDQEKKQFLAWIEEQETQGCRVLAIAKQELKTPHHEIPINEQDLSFLGLIAFADTLKSSVIPSIKRAQKAGITVKILSGDSPQVSAAVAREIGILSNNNQIITGQEFDALAPEAKKKAAHHCVVFARITPEQKCAIVALLQEDTDVAFLGEGINDAKVLKAATIGIAVNNATDVAKEAADIIILENNLSVIIDGIMVGRQVFTNTLKYLSLTLSANFSNFYTISIATLLMDHLPMLPLQLLFVNLLTDLPMMFIAYDKTDPEELRRPKNYDFRRLIYTSIIMGSICTICDSLFLAIFFKAKASVVQTNWFMFSVINDGILFLCLRTKSFFLKAALPHIWVMTLVGGCTATALTLPFTSFGQNILKFTAPSGSDLLTIISILIINVIGIEIVKAFLAYYREKERMS